MVKNGWCDSDRILYTLWYRKSQVYVKVIVSIASVTAIVAMVGTTAKAIAGGTPTAVVGRMLNMIEDLTVAQ